MRIPLIKLNSLIEKYKKLGIGQEKYINKEYIRPDRDSNFLELAYKIAERSHDSETAHGTVIVRENRIIATGFNGFPPGLTDHVIPNIREDNAKYPFINHAEKNAIFNAAKEGVSLQNSKIYITGMPCSNCAKALVTVGIFEWIIGDRGYVADENEVLLRNFWIDMFDVKIIQLKGSHSEKSS